MGNTLALCIINTVESSNIKITLRRLSTYVKEIYLICSNTFPLLYDLIDTYKNINIITCTNNCDVKTSKNYILNQSKCDYILFINSNETISEEQCSKLYSLTDTLYDGFAVKIEEYIDNICNNYYEIRLFKIDKNIFFQGCINDTISFSLNNNNFNTIQSTLVLERNLSPKDFILSNKNKFSLINSTKKNKKDGYYYFCVGEIFMDLKDYKSAETYFKKSTFYSRNEFNIEFVYSVYLAVSMSICLLEQNKIKDCLENIQYWLNIFPNHKDLFFIEGMCFLKLFHYSEALNSFKKYKSSNCSFYGTKYFYTEKNVDSIIDELNPLSLDSNIKFTTIIITDNSIDTNTILSINEISSNILIICDDTTNNFNIENLSINNITIFNKKEKTSINLNFILDSDYIFILNNGEIFPIDTQKNLISNL